MNPRTCDVDSDSIREEITEGAIGIAGVHVSSLSRDGFLEALDAEGVPARSRYGHPLTEQPTFARDHVRSLLPEPVDVARYPNESQPGTEEVIDPGRTTDDTSFV